MKKSSGNLATKTAFALAALFGAMSAFGAESDPNQLLSFKKMFLERVQDNVDGAFQAPVEQSYKEIFERNPRFEVVLDKGVADSAVRTRLEKKSSGLDIEISLIVLGTNEVFSTDRSTIPPTASGRETGLAVKELLKTTLKRVPFYGTVTGRDGTNLTFDIGAAHGLKQGDTIQVSRVDNVKRHPLLKSIVDVQLVPVGSASVESVEGTISFGKVHDEIAGESIQRMHKITAIEARATEPSRDRRPSPTRVSEVTESGIDSDRPQIGYVGLGFFLGSFSSTSSQNGQTFSGSAFDPGVKLQTEIWLTKRWFADLSLGLSSMSYRQTDTSLTEPPETPGVSSNTRSFGFDIGYKYLPNGQLYGPQAFVKLGYCSFGFNTSVNAAELLSSKSYAGLNLGVGGTLPLGTIDSGLMLNINVLLFPSLTEDGFKTGLEPSANGVNFFLGGYYYLSPRIALKTGFQFESYSADFGQDSTSSTSQNSIGFLPSILYYF